MVNVMELLKKLAAGQAYPSFELAIFEEDSGGRGWRVEMMHPDLIAVIIGAHHASCPGLAGLISNIYKVGYLWRCNSNGIHVACL